MTQSLVRSDHDQTLDALRKVIYELQSATDIKKLSEIVTTYIQEDLGYELVWVGLYDAKCETIDGSWNCAPESKTTPEALSVLPGDLFDQVLLTRRTATITNLQEEARVGSWQKLAKKLNIQGTILQTIRYQKESLGILLIGTTKWGVNPRKEESEQFTILANTLGATLQFLNAKAQPLSGSLNSSIHPQQSFNHFLQLLTQQSSWEGQLSTILQELTQTHPESMSGLYLLDPDSGDFVSYHIHKPQAKRVHRNKKNLHTLTIHQNLSFFRILERQQSLEVNDVSSSFGASAPTALVSFLNVRALLIQPILVDGSLKGFLFLGHPDPMKWNEQDQEILTVFAQLVELTYPSAYSKTETIDTLEEAEGNSQSNICILPSPLSEPEKWEKGLSLWFQLLTRRFQCQCSILLTYDAESKCYFPTQYFSSNRRSKLDNSVSFSELSQVDEKLLIRSENAIALNNLKEDMRFVAWHDSLFSEGIQSVLVSRVSQGNSSNELLILGSTTARTWSNENAKDLGNFVLNLRQAHQRRQVHVDMLQEKRLNQVFRQGLKLLQTSKSSQSFIEKAAEILVDLFEVSACGILLWPPSRNYAKVKASLSQRRDQFSIPLGTKVEISDPLIQQLLNTARVNDILLKPLEINSDSLSEETQRWITTDGNWSLLGLPLQPQPKQAIFGILILATPTPKTLNVSEVETLSDFARHMAWVLSNGHVNEAWRKDYEVLHTTHWYQNKSLERTLDSILNRSKDRASESKPMQQETLSDNNNPMLTEMSQALTRLTKQNAELIPSLDLDIEALTLVRLLREVLDQLEPIFSARQIWVQVHHLKQSNLALKSSRRHLIAVLDEVLKAATDRSEVGGRIDIWCQMTNPEWLDLSITDSGALKPRFIRDLHQGHYRDRLRSSSVSQDIGHRLLACKSLIQVLGGKLDVLSMADGRTQTRLTLPCVTN